MLIRITWALVVVGFGLLLGGFLASDQNILLILAIFVELAAIILVLASWARRAKDAADAYDEDLEFEVSDDTAGDEDILETFVDEEFAVGARGQGRRKPAGRKPAARAGAKPAARAKSTVRKPAAKPAARSAAKPAAKRKPAARSQPTAKRKPTAKPKPAARAKPQARKPAKPKPQRRRPSSE